MNWSLMLSLLIATYNKNKKFLEREREGVEREWGSLAKEEDVRLSCCC
jgi:hypothetical protein